MAIEVNENNVPEIKPSEEMMFTPFEPKCKNRFVAYMDDVPSFVMKGIKRPMATVKDGEYSWDNLEIVLYDPIVPSTAQAMYSFIRDKVTHFDKIKIQCLGPVGDVVEEWSYKNCEILSIDFCHLDWNFKGDPSTIKVILKVGEVVLEF